MINRGPLDVRFLGLDPAEPSGLSRDSLLYGSYNSVLQAVLEHGRGMVCILSGPAAEGPEVGGGGAAAAGAGASAASPKAPRAGMPGGNGAAHVRLNPEAAGFGAKRARQESQEEGRAQAAPAAVHTPFVRDREVFAPPVVPLKLSVLAELHGEIRLEVFSSTTVGEVLDRIQCWEGEALAPTSGFGKFKVYETPASPITFA